MARGCWVVTALKQRQVDRPIAKNADSMLVASLMVVLFAANRAVLFSVKRAVLPVRWRWYCLAAKMVVLPVR